MDGPRHIWWNFVSSSKQRIEQAKEDWRQRRFALVPGETSCRCSVISVAEYPSVAELARKLGVSAVDVLRPSRESARAHSRFPRAWRR
jgi:hypothetical protein